MAHEQALQIVNSLQSQLSTLVRGILNALRDKKISPWEGMQLGMQGSNLALFVIMMLQEADAETRKDILFVLENMEIGVKE